MKLLFQHFVKTDDVFLEFPVNAKSEEVKREQIPYLVATTFQDGKEIYTSVYPLRIEEIGAGGTDNISKVDMSNYLIFNGYEKGAKIIMIRNGEVEILSEV